MSCTVKDLRVVLLLYVLTIIGDKVTPKMYYFQILVRKYFLGRPTAGKFLDQGFFLGGGERVKFIIL